MSIFPAYHLEVDYLNGSPINSAATAPLTLGCQTTSGSCIVVLSYLEEVVTWDHRDKALEPRNGFYTSLSLQEGGGPLQGDFGYFRVLPDLRAYVSFLDDNALTFAARLQVGELWSISRRERGGDPVLRRRRQFDARLLRAPAVAAARGAGPGTPPATPATGPPTETVPIGGNGMFMGSFEARYSVLDNVRVATFVDVGQVTTGLFGVSDLPGVLWAVGVGLRYLTPIGPIRLDLARRLPFGTLPALYTTDTAGAINQSALVPRRRELLRLLRFPPGHPGERRRVHPADLDRGGLLRALRIAGVTILVVLAIALLAIGGLWTFAQTDRGGEIIRRIAVEKVDARIAGQLAVERLRFGGDRLTLDGVVLRDPEGAEVARVGGDRCDVFALGAAAPARRRAAARDPASRAAARPRRARIRRVESGAGARAGATVESATAGGSGAGRGRPEHRRRSARAGGERRDALPSARPRPRFTWGPSRSRAPPTTMDARRGCRPTFG